MGVVLDKGWFLFLVSLIGTYFLTLIKDNETLTLIFIWRSLIEVAWVLVIKVTIVDGTLWRSIRNVLLNNLFNWKVIDLLNCGVLAIHPIIFTWAERKLIRLLFRLKNNARFINHPLVVHQKSRAIYQSISWIRISSRLNFCVIIDIGDRISVLLKYFLAVLNRN